MTNLRARLPALACAIFLLAFACADGDPPAPQEAAPDAVAAFAPGSLEIRLKPFVEGFSNPLGAGHAGDGTNWLFVLEQDGLVKIVRRGEVLAQPFLDVSDRTEGGGEQGLLGLAFHPDYESNGLFYVNYTDLAGDTVIAEYKKSTRTRADASSERILLQYDQPFANHNGGGMAFGPDGYLYISSGDGGGAADPMGNGQRTDTLLGKILRIDVDETTPTTEYGIPPDNPFVGDPLSRPEIWDFGLRNPWRISFDRKRGDLWIADVGQNAWEEINREPAGFEGGGNYGWNVKEGSRCFPSGTDCAGVGDDFIDPITEYNHDEGCSVTGGYVYRGKRYPAMTGGYFFSDYCSGNIWAIKSGGPAEQRPSLLLDSGLPISSFAETATGELIVVAYNGELLKVAGTSE